MSANVDSPISEFFGTLPGPLRSKMLHRERAFLDRGFSTPGALLGVLTPEVPPDFNIGERCMTARARTIFQAEFKPDQRMKRLETTLKLPPHEVKALVDAARTLAGPLERSKPGDSEWYLGALC